MRSPNKGLIAINRVLLVTAFGAALAIAGCGGGKTEPQPAAAPVAQPVATAPADARVQALEQQVIALQSQVNMLQQQLMQMQQMQQPQMQQPQMQQTQ